MGCGASSMEIHAEDFPASSKPADHGDPEAKKDTDVDHVQAIEGATVVVTGGVNGGARGGECEGASGGVEGESGALVVEGVPEHVLTSSSSQSRAVATSSSQSRADLKHTSTVTDKNTSGDTKDIAREDGKETTNGLTPTMDEIKQENINDRLKSIKILFEEDPMDAESIISSLVESVLLTGDFPYCSEQIEIEGVRSLMDKKLSRDICTTFRYLLSGFTKASALFLFSVIQENDQNTVELVLLVLLSSTPQQILDIVTEFQRVSGHRSLLDVLGQNLLGDFQRFVAAILEAGRDSENEPDAELAATDLETLSKSSDLSWEGAGSAVSTIFLSRSYAQLLLTFELFHKETGTGITEFIRDEFSFYHQKSLLFVVEIARSGVSGFLAGILQGSTSKSYYYSLVVWTIAARYKEDLREVCKLCRGAKCVPVQQLINDTPVLSEQCKQLLIALISSVSAS